MISVKSSASRILFFCHKQDFHKELRICSLPDETGRFVLSKLHARLCRPEGSVMLNPRHLPKKQVLLFPNTSHSPRIQFSFIHTINLLFLCLFRYFVLLLHRFLIFRDAIIKLTLVFISRSVSFYSILALYFIKLGFWKP